MSTPKKECRLPSRQSWVSYYCTKKELQGISDFIFYSGLVHCSICGQHFDNVQFIRHTLSHLLINEHCLGTLMLFEFCAECLCFPHEVGMNFHHQIHRHVEKLDPLSLLDGNFVCPICEISFSTILKFASHLYERHVHLDSPYVCTICYAFRSSYYCELFSHFSLAHRNTNHLFCPYCLKHFELPVRTSVDSDTYSFGSREFYFHVHQHWDQTTYRCESCRLDFIHRKDYKLHEYLHHTGHPIIKPVIVYEKVDEPPPLEQKDQLCLSYSNKLFTQTPRLSLRCLECGDYLRQPVNKHFNLTLKCTSCSYTSSCIVSVNWHWSNVHSAPPIPQTTDSSYELKSWQTSINRLAAGCKTETKPAITHNQRTYNPCGSLSCRMRRGRDKHAPPGLFSKGVLRCKCGFRTIVCDQMAHHLAVEGRDHFVAILDYTPRLSLFTVRSGGSKVLRTSLWWQRKVTKTPLILRSVGLC